MVVLAWYPPFMIRADVWLHSPPATAQTVSSSVHISKALDGTYVYSTVCRNNEPFNQAPHIQVAGFLC